MTSRMDGIASARPESSQRMDGAASHRMDGAASHKLERVSGTSSSKPSSVKKKEDKGPPVHCEVHADAVVCNDAKIQGKGGITIGEGTVVHPACQIHAKEGPIVIGAFNILEELVEILNDAAEPLVIGDHNTFEVGSRIIGSGVPGGSPIVGNANIFECRAQLLAGASVGDGCTLGVHAVVRDGEQLPDETVVVGPPGLRHCEMGAKEAHIQAVQKQIEVLKETLPRCHPLRKTTKV